MKVAELIERLQKMPQDAEVGSSDDCGEIEEIYDVSPPDTFKTYVELHITRGMVVND